MCTCIYIPYTLYMYYISIYLCLRSTECSKLEELQEINLRAKRKKDVI